MDQTLKVSISRGGCRFATPLYLGSKYVLSFDGDRADEAAVVLFVKPTSGDATKSDEMSALAKSETDSETGAVSLNLNKKALLDWFEDCGECDVDGSVDAHCYVFDADGTAIADAGVTVEWKPVQFAVDETEIAQWKSLDERVSSVEAGLSVAEDSVSSIQSSVAALAEADAANLKEAKDYANEMDAENMAVLRGEITEMKGSVTSVQMVHEEGASTTGKTYHKVTAVKEDGVWTLGVKQEPEEFSSGTQGALAVLDANQTFTGTNAFTGEGKGVSVMSGASLTVGSTGSATFAGSAKFLGSTQVPKAADDSDDTTAASTSWVRTAFSSLFSAAWNAAKAAFLSAYNTWSGKQTFAGDAALKSSAVEAGTVPATTLYGPHLSFQDKNGASVGLAHGTFESAADGGRYGVTLEAQSKTGGYKAGVSALFDADGTSTVKLVADSVEVPDATVTAADFADVTGLNAVNFAALMSVLNRARVVQNVSVTTTAGATTITGLVPGAKYRLALVGLTKSATYKEVTVGVGDTVYVFSFASPTAVAYAVRRLDVATHGSTTAEAVFATANSDGKVFVSLMAESANVVVSQLELTLVGLPYAVG